MAAKDSTKPHVQVVADELLRRAICLALELEVLLETRAAEGSFRFRLARAHTLSATDVLTELALQRPVPEVPPISGIYPAPVIPGTGTE
jgi:hypothetical protein